MQEGEKVGFEVFELKNRDTDHLSSYPPHEYKVGIVNLLPVQYEGDPTRNEKVGSWKKNLGIKSLTVVLLDGISSIIHTENREMLNIIKSNIYSS